MDIISMTQHLIKGRKGGSSSPRTPTEQPDDLQSVAKAKILMALGEGEFAGALTAKDIYLDGTPLENSDGSQNFSGVVWEFRSGTQAQNYIQGIPGSENEINVGTEISSKTAWTHSFSNTQLSAVRLRLKWPSLFKQEDNGDLMGNSVSYAVDLQTDGGTWQTVLESAVTGKTSSGYERCHRIDLPRANTGWVLRLRKVTEDVSTSKIGDVMTLQSYAEILDAKLRYPNTALLYVEFDSRQFNGSIPKIACSPRGRVIRVPDNYDPETRQYSGIWTGAFKWAWTDNPAWIFYDLIVTDRFGLGNRLTSENIDKWTLYQVARYCDEPVPDGKGGDGTEPRYLCNVYIQDRNDAYTVLRDFAAIFRGMTCWSGDQVIALADMPRDIDYTYTRANVINGRFQYASSSSKTRYTNALVSWSDPENEYADAMEPVFEQPLVARYGFNQLELTAIGCTRQSEANRKGRWGILTNNKDRVVTFSVGLDGNIPQPGYVIAVADEMLAGKVNGGRTSKVDGCVITLDRKTEAKTGDRLLMNLPSGVTQSRTIQDVDGYIVTVTTEYTEVPETECVWAVESDSLKVQQYRVVSVKDNNDSTFTISAAAHDPDKYARIDTGAVIDSRPISVIPPGNQSAPANIVVESYSVVNQGMSVETLQVHWSAVKNAISYEAQWRRNEGNWVNIPRSSVSSFDVVGIYAGRYTVRVRAINAAEVSSGWSYSEEKMLTGKIGMPSAPIALTTTSLMHGVELNWGFPDGAGDTQKTELQYSPNPNGSGAMALSDVAYPGKTYQQMGLQIAATFWYRVRIVDRLGNESPWTSWVQGQASDNISEYYDQLTDAIKDTPAWQEVQRDIGEAHEELTKAADAIRDGVAQQVTDINQSLDETVAEIGKQVDGQIDSVNKSITENIDLVNQTLSDNISAVNKSITDAVTDINTSIDQQITDVNKTLTEGDAALKSQLQTVENSLKQSIAQANTGWDKAVKQETADRTADVNAKAAQAADQLLNEKIERVAAIDTLQTIIQDGDESLARQISEISAGSGQQFDSFNIWYFDKDNEGWTEDDAGQVPMQITDDGWLKASNSSSSCRSPNGQKIPSSSYRTIMLRIKRVGNPVWKGRLYWIGAEETGWSDARSVNIAEQEFDGDDISVVAISDVNWNASGTVRRFRLDLAPGQNADNYFLIHWISVGRPAPAASTAALRNEEMARTQADEAEVLKRSTLAAQIRGTTDSNSLSDLRSGLLYQEMNARITADRAEVVARESLQTQFNDNKSTVAEELSSLSTAQGAQASKISGLETTLGKKADASALQSLTQKVEQQGTTITSQGSSLTSLTNRVGTGTWKATIDGVVDVAIYSSLKSGAQYFDDFYFVDVTDKVNIAANAGAISSLNTTVTQHEKTITSQSNSLTSLNNSIGTLQAQVGNPWFDGSLESYAAGAQVGNSSLAAVSTAYAFSGSKSLCARRPSGDSGNSDKLLGTRSSVRESGIFRIELWAMMPANQAPSSGWSTIVGINAQNSAGSNSWNGAVTINEVSLGGRGKWVKFSGTCSIPAKMTRGLVWISCRGATGSGTPGYELYIDDVVITDITDANAAQNTANANASALTALTSRVTSAEGTLTSQSNAVTKLQNDLATTNSNVSKKADAAALNSLTSRVTNAEGKLDSQSSSITQLEASLDSTRDIGENLVENYDFRNQLNAWNQQNPSRIVWGATSGDGSAGVVITHTGDANNPGLMANNAKWFPVSSSRRFRFKVRAKLISGSGGILCRIFNSKTANTYTQTQAYVTKTGAFETLTVNLSVLPESATDAHIAFYAYPSATVVAIDSIAVYDVTDEIASSTNASAISALTTRVTSAEGTITSQSTALTKLQNDLSTTNTNVNKKADQSALTSLTGRVANTESGLTAANSNITGLTSAIRAVGAAGDDYIPNPTFDPAYDQMGRVVVDTSSSGVPVGCPFKYAAKLASRDHIPGINNIAATAGDVIEFSALVACGAGTAAFNLYVGSAESPTGGIAAANAGGAVSAATGKTWVRTTWRWTVTATVAAKGYFRPFLQIAQTSPYGTIWYVTDWHCRNITAAAKAQSTADATASAVDSLTTKVTQQGDTLSSIGTRTTALENGLKTTNTNVSNKADASAVQTLQNMVTQQGKDITSANSAITKLTSDLSTTNANVNRKADATALQSLQNTVTEQGKTLTSQGSSLTQLNNALSDTTASLAADGKIPGNLISNGSFERGQDAFTGWSSIASVISAQSPNYGGKILMCSTGLAGISQQVPVVKGNTYKIGVFARAQGGSVMNDQGNNKLRIGQASLLYDRQFNTANLPTNASWIELTGTWKATVDGIVSVSVNSSLKSGAQYFDDFYFVDITDEVNISANSGAISTLNSWVTKSDDTLKSQSESIKKLTN